MSERRPASELWLSDQGKRVLAEREGFELTAYHDTRGILTIGLGHTSAAGPPKVYEGMEITEDEAWMIFQTDTQRFRKECLKLVKSPLTQYEFDALGSFIFNIGSTNFAGSTALKLLNARDYEGCGEAMLMWSKPPEVRSRRKGESEQFLKGTYTARIS